MGTVYSTLGARLDVVEMLDGLMQGADRDLVKVWQKMNAPRFDNIMLKTKTVGAKATPAGIEVSFEGEGAPAPQTYDKFLRVHGVDPLKSAMFEDLARNLVVPHQLGMTTVLVVPDGAKEVVREDWELEGRDSAYVDHVTDDLTGFLVGLGAR